ncbi:MAG: hypothetical protein M9894_28965 [Planctomycetes bacterium]|nr:hypothetical protein [Planctomycetota bacterium]
MDEELETLVAEADEADEEEAAATPEPVAAEEPAPGDAMLAPAALRTLFEAVRVVPSPAGGAVRLEASPAAAAALGTLFEGMAALLRAQGAATSGVGRGATASSRQPDPAPGCSRRS